MLLIKNIKLEINKNENDLKELIEKKLKTSINSFEIYRKSLDARKEPIYVYSFLVSVDNEDKYLKKDIEKYTKKDLFKDDEIIVQKGKKTFIKVKLV